VGAVQLFSRVFGSSPGWNQAMRKVTIEDISRHTGLSRGTVSRALNNRPDISLQTKQRVLEACQQLNYVPSHAARSLATGRCYAVAVLVRDLRSAFAGMFLRGVLAQAQGEQYAVHVSELGDDARQSVDHLCTVANERVDSVLLATPLPTDLSRRLTEALDGRPLIAAEAIAGFDCDAFIPDYAEAGRLVARHILRGATPDVLYVHEEGSAAGDMALAGFEQECRAQGLGPEAVTIRIPATGPHRLQAVQGRIGNIRAIAASNDYVAVEMMMLCRAEGRVPGEHIAIIGQGNEHLTTRISPTLTTIDYCGEEIGRRAMALAIQRVMKTRQDAAQHTPITPQLIVRESSRLLG
jgi:LacI family transcriptional regulator